MLRYWLNHLQSLFSMWDNLFTGSRDWDVDIFGAGERGILLHITSSIVCGCFPLLILHAFLDDVSSGWHHISISNSSCDYSLNISLLMSHRPRNPCCFSPLSLCTSLSWFEYLFLLFWSHTIYFLSFETRGIPFSKKLLFPFLLIEI